MSKFARTERTQGRSTGGWTNVDVRMNSDGTFDVLENIFLNDIGPRMEKGGDPFPDWPRLGIKTHVEALDLGHKWDEWCESQTAKKKARAKAAPEPEVHETTKVHFEPKEKATVPPPPVKAKAAPKPRPAPPPPPAESPLGLF